VVFLVNEFAALDVDTPLLAAHAPAIGISGGSIFCRCRAVEFMSALGRIAREHPGCAGVVVEASGMADPGSAGTLLAEARLDRTYALGGTVTLVDPAQLPKVLDTLPAAERQVAAATAVVIAKADLHPAAVLDRAEALVRGLNPTAQVVRAAHGNCDLDPLALDGGPALAGEPPPCADPALLAVELPCPGRLRRDDLARSLAALGSDLYRAKGLFADAAGWCRLDWSAGRMTLLAAAPGAPGLALIIHPRARAAADELVRQMAAGAFSA
jgi:hypothetical protein